MAEIVVYGIVRKVITDLGSHALQEIGSAVAVQKELKKFERTVITIKDVLLHAEELQLVNPEVRTWLRRIKDVAYEADDVIDDFTIEALKKKLVIQGNINKMVRNFFTSSNPFIFRFNMARRIKEIREKMIEIRDDRSFILETRVEAMRHPNSARENTHSYIDESEVFGREDVKEEIVEALLAFDGEEKLSIFSIQGLGGLGKTTLAKLVCNDKRVIANFKPLWVCVSQEFDVKTITEKIIKSATNAPCPNVEMDQLQYRLREELGEKRFLLVLDDVWNEDVNKWDELKGLLQGGAVGSKLIVTTRSTEVARIISLNYNHLSFSLRQCFAYFSFFPKDVVFDKMTLIQTWIAQGFIHSSGQNQSLEDIGNDYVESLMWIAFLQEREVDLYKNVICFTMHDLVHDLAQSVAGVECFDIDHEDTTHIPEGVQYLHCTKMHFSLEALEDLPKPYKLRALYALCELKSHVKNIFSSFTFLRVLGLDVNDKFQKLPSSIGELKHLRYLDLWSDSITTVTLPKSIIKLQRLQTLEFSRCCKIRELPQDMQRMSELRHIFIREEDSAMYSHMPLGLGQLTSLQTLSVFVVGRDRIGCKLNELHSLRHLRGKLTIKNLENVVNARDSADANLMEKPNLEELKLVWNEKLVEVIPREEIDFDVLETLQPNQSLKGLFIEGYGGVSFSRWLMESPFPNLVMISFKKCRKCGQIPPFGKLQFLEFLELEEMNDLRFMDQGGNRSSRGKRDCIFPSLKELKLSNVPNLESWLAVATEEETCTAISLPCLIKLTISGCPKLTSMPLLPSLEKFWIKEIPKLESIPEGLQNAIKLRSLRIWDCEGLVTLPECLGNLTFLQELVLFRCCNLMTWPNGLLTNLKSSLVRLAISGSSSLLSLPEELQHLTCLQFLMISYFADLMTLPEWLGNLTSLYSLLIGGCPKLVCLPRSMSHLTSLQQLMIDRCDQLRPRCMKNIGEDWPYIAHIRHIELDDVRLQ
ncbi:hypothetical protein AQUCO_05400038v1 [Aquilegia coerulea]|uniref:Uncharacterized protein n=1 Tax=Aquilegia coerulea TaxID=218851 RepID=A0A2G5CHB9_AQUCA|nr:hypothetical protein AQUCO_05400038v1 [Aquilegia coerulea]